MTIDDAIRILESRVSSPFMRANPKSRDAMQLGIEALKVIRQSRAVGSYTICPLLPGETEK
jgi:hypothetical protein